MGVGFEWGWVGSGGVGWGGMGWRGYRGVGLRSCNGVEFSHLS